MKKLPFLTVLFFWNFCFAQTKQSIEITTNHNLETFSIVERLSLKHSRFLKIRDSLLNVQPITRPLVKLVHEKFSLPKNEAIVIQLAKLIDTLYATKSGGQDIFLGYLVLQKPFPIKGKLNPFTFLSKELSDGQNKYIDNQIHSFIENLNNFYTNNNVEDFLKKNKSFYDGCINEVKKYIPLNVIDEMNSYYRVENRNKYTVIVMPSRPWANGEWSANGPKNNLSNGGKHMCNILSSYVEVSSQKNINDYTTFGFDDKNWVEEICVHEFGHSYVNDDLNAMNDVIEKNTKLFNGTYEEEMQKVSTWNWRVCVEEHIVRTIEIRIADLQKNQERANKLRNEYINKDKYIFIPMLEEKMKEYENDKVNYPTFKTFLPVIIQTLNSITVKQRDELLKPLVQK